MKKSVLASDPETSGRGRTNRIETRGTARLGRLAANGLASVTAHTSRSPALGPDQAVYHNGQPVGASAVVGMAGSEERHGAELHGFAGRRHGGRAVHQGRWRSPARRGDGGPACAPKRPEPMPIRSLLIRQPHRLIIPKHDLWLTLRPAHDRVEKIA